MGHPAIKASAAVSVSPDTLRVNDTFTFAGKGFGVHNLMIFTYDINKPIFDENGKPLEVYTDSRGMFSVQIRVPADWVAGQHFAHVTDEAEELSITAIITVQEAPLTPAHLQLSKNTLNFDIGATETVSGQTITLSNAGGGQVIWQASSDEAWLTTTPDNGTFAGSQNIQIKVNCSSLAPQTYTGHINFMQNGDTASLLTLAVTMVVKPDLTLLDVTPGSLSYSTTLGQSPASKAITLQNSGGQPLSWTASATTIDQGQWLGVTPASGALDAGSQVNMSVNVDGSMLKAGSYQGTVTLTSDNLTKLVAVSLTVTPPPAPVISVPTSPLTLTAIKGTNPDPQTITLTNTGNLVLNWTATENGNAFVSSTPSQGSLPPGQSVALTISSNVSSSSAGVLASTLTIADSDAGSTVSSQKIPVTVTIKDQAVITVAPSGLIFNNTSTFTHSSQSLIVGNTGSASLNWTIAQSAVPWLSVDTSSGAVAPGGSTVLNVYCDSTDMAPGTYTATLVISDSDAGTPVTPQSVSVTLVVS